MSDIFGFIDSPLELRIEVDNGVVHERLAFVGVVENGSSNGRDGLDFPAECERLPLYRSRPKLLEVCGVDGGRNGEQGVKVSSRAFVVLTDECGQLVRVAPATSGGAEDEAIQPIHDPSRDVSGFLIDQEVVRSKERCVSQREAPLSDPDVDRFVVWARGVEIAGSLLLQRLVNAKIDRVLDM